MNVWDCNWKLFKINKLLNLFMFILVVYVNVNVFFGLFNGFLIYFCILYVSFF